MRIVVTGALGHIGSRLIRILPLRFPSADLVLIDNLSSQRYASLFDLAPTGTRFIEADVTTEDLDALFAGADVVIHLAAITDATQSFDRRAQVEAQNLGGTTRVAEACGRQGARLVFVSSTSVYGRSDGRVDEEMPDALQPQSPYAETKLREEAAIESVAERTGMRFAVLRFGTIFGPSTGMRFHTAVNRFCWQAVLGKPLTVWRTALHQRRPYLDLEDAVRALVHCIERDVFDNRVYNVLTGNHTVAEVVEAIRKLVPDIRTTLVDAEIMNQLSYEVDDARIRSTGFRPRGQLDDGVAATIEMLRGAAPAERTIGVRPAGRQPGELYTRDQFEARRRTWAESMHEDRRLREAANDLLGRADRYQWIHQGSWMGEPLLNVAQDVMALQEIAWRTRPRWIIELGVAWGGSLLFSSTLIDVLGGSGVIGVDTFLPDDLRARLKAQPRLARHLHLIEGSSVSAETLARVREIVGDCREVLVVLDSDHTHDHVLAELRAYAPLVGAGHYIVCGDTIVEELPPQRHRPRAWGPGNNPATALRAFLDEDDRFEVDRTVDAKLLLTCNPGGYLRARADAPPALD